MHASMRDFLKAGGAVIIDCVELVYSGFTLRLSTGQEVVVGGNAYLPRNDTYATLDAVSGYEDGLSDQAPRCQVALLPVSAAAFASLVDPSQQGASITAFWVAVDEATGLIVGQAEQPFRGFVDTADFSVDGDVWRLSLDCGSGLDRALASGEGMRLSDTFHQTLWPGELGCAFVTGLPDPVWWGILPPGGGITSIFPGGGTSTGSGGVTTGGGRTVFPGIVSSV